MNNIIKKLAIIAWLTALWFVLLGNAHAWDVPSSLRVVAGARLWFSLIDGDLIQPSRTKLDIKDNLGIKQDQVAWEYFAIFRFANMHALRIVWEPRTFYDQSKNDSFAERWSLRTGYDLDLYMSPQALIGTNLELEVFGLDTRVNNVTVGGQTFNYSVKETTVIPSVGLHGTFYPALKGIALRPNVSTRVNWWSDKRASRMDVEVASAVDVPINRLWTWTVTGGYRIKNNSIQRSRDTADLTWKGFFIESSVLY